MQGLKRTLWGLICILSYSNLIAQEQKNDSLLIINDISIKGNKKTKDFVIVREIDFVEGDTISSAILKEKILLNQRRIFNTTLFSKVDVLPTVLVNNLVDIKIIVKENWYIWAAPYFRLNDRNFNEWLNRGSDLGRLNYGFFIDNENFLGRSQKVEFVFETGFTNRYTLRYNVPYIDKKRNTGLISEFRFQNFSNLAYTTSNNQLDFVYRDEVLKTQVEAKVKLRRRQGFYSFHFLEFGFNQVSISDSLRILNPNYLSQKSDNQQFVTLAYTFRFDKRDNINFPLKGRTFIADIRRVGILPNDNFNSWQFRFAFADYYPLGKKLFGNYILKAKAFTNPDVPYNILRGIGYEEDVLRGYDLYVVNGTAYGSGRINIKREVFNRTFHLKFIKWRQFNLLPLQLFVNAFSDWGYVYNKYPERINNSLVNNTLRSFGVGLEVSTFYNSVIRFNVSRNHLNETNFFINFQKDIWTKWN
jgi:outer membrane protein assembly factor BamA